MSLAPTLVFAWGNASRGDDALGPRFAQALRERLGGDAGVEVLDDYQLQIEHALDLEGRERVLFVDASADARPPFELTRVAPARTANAFGTHAMSPQALLQVFVDVQRHAPPPCWLLAIRGERFELGAPVAPAAERHLDEALRWAGLWLERDEVCGISHEDRGTGPPPASPRSGGEPGIRPRNCGTSRIDPFGGQPMADTRRRTAVDLPEDSRPAVVRAG